MPPPGLQGAKYIPGVDVGHGESFYSPYNLTTWATLSKSVTEYLDGRIEASGSFFIQMLSISKMIPTPGKEVNWLSFLQQARYEDSQLYVPTSFPQAYYNQQVVQLFLKLDPKGILYSHEVNQLEPLSILSRFGGLWAFVGLIFGLLYTGPANWQKRWRIKTSGGAVKLRCR